MGKLLDDIIIINPSVSELEVRKTLLEAYGFLSEQDSFDPFWALTYSLKPSEWNWLKKTGRTLDETLGYLHSLLKIDKFKGVFVVEYTKKGVPHLHGIVLDICKEHLEQKYHKKGKKFDVYYINNTINRSHVLKPIRNKKAYNGWVDYMIKDYTPLSILQYFNLSYPLECDEERAAHASC